MDYRSVWIDEITLFEITPGQDYVPPLPPHWPSEASDGIIDTPLQHAMIHSKTHALTHPFNTL